MIMFNPGKIVRNPGIEKLRKRQRERLDKVREEVGIPYSAMKEVCKEVLGREVEDVNTLGVTESRKVVKTLLNNFGKMRERYKRFN